MAHQQLHDWNLAHANIGRLRAPLTDPTMAGFTNQLERINTLGWEQPGFVQHIVDLRGSPRLTAFDDPRIVMNLTVWVSIEALREFTFRTEHAEFLRRRREWFEPMDGPGLALWWIPTGHAPTPEEARERLALLAERGPTPMAFTFARSFGVKKMLAWQAQASAV